MATKPRTLSDEEYQAALDWLRSKAGEPGKGNCPTCGSDTWTVHRDRVGIFTIDHAQLFPGVVVSCNHCGKMDVFNTLTMGIDEPEPKDVPESQEDDG